MSHFGPAIIGAKKFAAEQEDLKSGKHLYGPSVLGSHKKVEKKNVVDEPAKVLVDDATPEPAKVDRESFSVRAVRDSLAENPVPAVIDRMVTAEMFRPDGPRKSALTECLRAEKRRENPRAEVVDMLTDAIKELE